MLDFDYSIDAKNVLNKFHQVDRVVYVEGEDDVLFWEVIFEKLAQFKVQLEPVGGKPELLKHAEAIYSGEADYLLAMDADYDHVFDEGENPLIIKTYGYSIENTLICKNSVCRILRNVARVSLKDAAYRVCNEWLSEINGKIKNLVLYDIVSVKCDLGLPIVPDSCERFMRGGVSVSLCDNKINEFIVRLGVAMHEEIEEEEASLLAKGYEFIDFIKGHFLFSAVIRFIKFKSRSLGKKITVSKDMLYSNLISVFELTFNNSHPHFEYYKRKVEAIPVSA